MGRPKKENTTILNFRVTESEKKLLNTKYPNLSKMFRDWINSLLK